MSEDLVVTLLGAIVVIAGQIMTTWQAKIAAEASAQAKKAADETKLAVIGQMLPEKTKEDIEAFRAKVEVLRRGIMERPK